MEVANRSSQPESAEAGDCARKGEVIVAGPVASAAAVVRRR